MLFSLFVQWEVMSNRYCTYNWTTVQAGRLYTRSSIFVFLIFYRINLSVIMNVAMMKLWLNLESQFNESDISDLFQLVVTKTSNEIILNRIESWFYRVSRSVFSYWIIIWRSFRWNLDDKIQLSAVLRSVWSISSTIEKKKCHFYFERWKWWMVVHHPSLLMFSRPFVLTNFQLLTSFLYWW